MARVPLRLPMTPRFRQAALLLLLIGLAVLAWYPTGLLLADPKGDQVWENFTLGATCSTARHELGWMGLVQAAGSSGGLFATSLAAAWVARASCVIASSVHLTPLQGYLVTGLALSFGLAAITSRLHGFRSSTALLVGFLICTAPFCFSRVEHLSLATAWAVVPGLLACHGLWRAMARAQPLWRSVLAGSLASALCLPTQDYYVAFTLLLGLSTFALLLLLATTRTTAFRPLMAMARRGLGFGIGFGVILLLLFSSKLQAVFAAGGSALPAPPPLWIAPRSVLEQFRYGLVPYTWLIPSPLLPVVQEQFREAGFPLVTESFLMSTGSLLIPLAWLVAIRRLSRVRHEAIEQGAPEQMFFAVLLFLCTALGLIVMTMGGVGTLFAAFVSPVLRSLNRFTVFVYGASVLLLLSEFDLWQPGHARGDRRRLLWGLVGLWTAVELMFSSRWWPPAPLPAASSGKQVERGSLRDWLGAINQPGAPQAPVWFAPYNPYPEQRFIDSRVRSGLYDTFLAFPSSGLTTNYGAGKAGPADTLFTLASVHGLSAEFHLARRLGYRFFALDLGAVTDLGAARDLCRKVVGCRISTDVYALFPIGAGEQLVDGLNGFQRRLALLPWQGETHVLSWGPLVMSQFQWGPVQAQANRPLKPTEPLLVPAAPGTRLEIFRHSLNHYPESLRPLMQLESMDIQIALPAGVRSVDFCIRSNSVPCRQFSLGPGRRRVAIGDHLRPGDLSWLEIRDVQWERLGGGAVVLELRLPAAGRSLLAGG